MCGINLILDKSGRNNTKAVQAMNTSIAHRGPDKQLTHFISSGMFSVTVGVTILEIMPSDEKEHQPFVSTDGNCVMVFNGEVYNFKRLLAKYLPNDRDIENDSPALFKLLCEKGVSILSELNGIFAFCFINLQKQQVWLVRDRFGVKPLFYSEFGSYLVVSSEIKGIFASSIIPKTLRKHSIPQYLKFRYAPKNFTFFEHVHPLEEGVALEYISKRFVNYSEISLQNQARFSLEQCLLESVSMNLQGRFTPTLMLSGGIDSSLLLALANKGLGKKLPSYTLSSESQKPSMAIDAARLFNSDLSIVKVGPTNLEESFHQMTASIDQPVGDGAWLLTHILAKEISKQTSVAWSGAGADELFGGYNRHKAIFIYWDWLRNNPFLIRLLKKFGGLNSNLRFVLGALEKDPLISFQNLSTVPGYQSMFLEKTSEFPIKSKRDFLVHDLHHYLVEDVLYISDLASMAHSIELRTPFLENGLMQYFGSAPEKNIRFGKKELRALLKKFGGSSLIQQKKEGFGVPVLDWYRAGNLPGFKTKITAADNPILEHISNSETRARIQKGDLRHPTELWSLLFLSAFLKSNS